MTERETEINREILRMIPGSDNQLNNYSVVPPIPDMLRREEFLKRYQSNDLSSPLLSTPSPSPHENRIVLSDKFKRYRRKIESTPTRDPRQSVHLLDQACHLKHRHSAPPYANRSCTSPNDHAYPTTNIRMGNTWADIQWQLKMLIEQTERDRAPQQKEPQKETYREYRLRQYSEAENAKRNIEKLIEMRTKQPSIWAYKTPTKNDFVFGFRGDVFMDLLEMKVLNDNPEFEHVKLISRPSARFECMKLKLFLLFLETKNRNDNTVSIIT